MMSTARQMTDFEFLGRQIEPRPHFLYAYTPDSAFLRSRIRQHITAYAEKASWTPMAAGPNETLHGTLSGASFLDDRFYICDASNFHLNDLDNVMVGIANDAFESHLCLMISRRSELLKGASWLQACRRVGVIEEPTVTIENYRGITRRILELSDLTDVRCFGEDGAFLSRMKAFVQGGRGRSPFELAVEIDRIVLTETEDGLVRPTRPEHGDNRGGEKLGELMARFLDHRSTASFHPLLIFIGVSFRSMKEPERLLTRLLRATAKIVAGSDRRYKRNRDGNPAVLPYLVWGIMLLRAEDKLRHGSFVVCFEQLCQAFNAAADETASWFAHPANWQDAAHALTYGLGDQPTALDRAREELRSALRTRVLGSGGEELRWLVAVASEAEQKRLVRAETKATA